MDFVVGCSTGLSAIRVTPDSWRAASPSWGGGRFGLRRFAGRERVARAGREGGGHETRQADCSGAWVATRGGPGGWRPLALVAPIDLPFAVRPR